MKPTGTASSSPATRSGLWEKVPGTARVVAVLHDVLEEGGMIDPARMTLTAEEI